MFFYQVNIQFQRAQIEAMPRPTPLDTPTSMGPLTNSVLFQMQILFCRLVACIWSFTRQGHVQTHMQKHSKTVTDSSTDTCVDADRQTKSHC